MYAVGLALCTFANISSEEMSRDLSHEIEKLLGSSNTYIRKKVGFHAQDAYPRSNFFVGGVMCVAGRSPRARPAGELYPESQGPPRRS